MTDTALPDPEQVARKLAELNGGRWSALTEPQRNARIGVAQLLLEWLPAAHVDEDDQGDGPDTFDDRLADLARLIDTLPDELDPDRRLRRRTIIVRLAALLVADATSQIALLLDPLDD